MHENKHGSEIHMILNFLLCWFLNFECPLPTPPPPPPPPSPPPPPPDTPQLVYNVTDLAAHLLASKIWILKLRYCVAVDNLLKNLSPKSTYGAPPPPRLPQPHPFPSLKIILNVKLTNQEKFFLLGGGNHDKVHCTQFAGTIGYRNVRQLWRSIDTMAFRSTSNTPTTALKIHLDWSAGHRLVQSHSQL